MSGTSDHGGAVHPPALRRTAGSPEDSSIWDRMTPSAYRAALAHVPTSVVLATAMLRDQPIGMVIGTFSSVSMDPPLVGFFGDSRSSTLRPLLECDRITFSLLPQDDLELVEIFQRPLHERFTDLDWSVSEFGTPILPSAVLSVHTKQHRVFDAGDHTCVLAEVLGVEQREGLHRPMVFYRHRLSRLDPGLLLDHEIWQLGWYDS